MKLAQNQVWKRGDEYLRIVQLERLRVVYKAIRNFSSGSGAHHQVSKKEFCRLLKDATLLTQEEIQKVREAEVDRRARSDVFRVVAKRVLVGYACSSSLTSPGES
jgi:hypothetical protein